MRRRSSTFVQAQRETGMSGWKHLKLVRVSWYKRRCFYCTGTRVAAFELRKNKPLTHYHTGAFGKLEKNFWSCCDLEGKDAEGCVESTSIDVSDSRDQREGSAPSPEADSGLRPSTDIELRRIKSMSLPINSETIGPVDPEWWELFSCYPEPPHPHTHISHPLQVDFFVNCHNTLALISTKAVCTNFLLGRMFRWPSSQVLASGFTIF